MNQLSCDRELHITSVAGEIMFLVKGALYRPISHPGLCKPLAHGPPRVDTCNYEIDWAIKCFSVGCKRRTIGTSWRLAIWQIQ
jgi:hypothetical protein